MAGLVERERERFDARLPPVGVGVGTAMRLLGEAKRVGGLGARGHARGTIALELGLGGLDLLEETLEVGRPAVGALEVGARRGGVGDE